jgi:hypothetical protein
MTHIKMSRFINFFLINPIQHRMVRLEFLNLFFACMQGILMCALFMAKLLEEIFHIHNFEAAASCSRCKV